MSDRLVAAWAERRKLWAECDKLRAVSVNFGVVSVKFRAEGVKLRAEGDLGWAQAILDVLGNVPVEWHDNRDCTVGGVRYVAAPTEED
jgi:hypothetical protein